MKPGRVRPRFLSAATAVIFVLSLIPALTVKAGAAEPDWLRIDFYETDATKLQAMINGAGAASTNIILHNDVTLLSQQLTIAAGQRIKLSGDGADRKCTIRQTGSGWRVIQVSSGTLYLENIIITGGSLKSSENGGGVCATGESSGIYILTGAEISGNITDRNGGGVYAGGVFCMSGGRISGNTAGKGGGGVYCVSTAAFTMDGGEISGNKTLTDDGGGIFINAPAHNAVIKASCRIIGNLAPAGNGGGVYITASRYGMLIVENGAIFSRNHAQTYCQSLTPPALSTYRGQIKVSDGAWSKYFKSGAWHALELGYNNYDISYVNDNEAPDDPPPGENALFIHKYAIDSVANAGKAPTGTAADQSAVDANPHVTGPLAGVPFEVYLILYLDKIGETISYDPAVSVDRITVDGVEYELVSPGGAVITPADCKTDEYGDLEFCGLEDGIYLVVEGDCGFLSEKAAPFLVTLPMEDPQSRGQYLSEVHVYPKNEFQPPAEQDDYQLPHTGGAGLLPFSVTGVLILGVVVALLAGGRRKSV